MIKVIVFDFDDTLVRSERIKQNSFIDIFHDVRGAESLVRASVAGNIGKPRSDVISSVLKKLQENGFFVKANTVALLDYYLDSYAQLTRERVVNAPEVLGVVDTFKKISKIYHCYINSATPDNAIKQIIQLKNWSSYFYGVFGSPPGTKTGNIQRILSQERINGAEMLIISNDLSDWRIAKRFKTQFIGVTGEFSDWKKADNILVASDLQGLPAIIANLK
jgi:phosphoglycolate phosphatase-like HAD superfamily hydrolase